MQELRAAEAAQLKTLDGLEPEMWQVALVGDAADLSMLAQSFASGDVIISINRDEYVLSSSLSIVLRTPMQFGPKPTNWLLR